MSDIYQKRRKQVREFAKQHIAPIAAKLDKHEEFSCELVQKLADFGLMACTLQASYGGLEWDEKSYLIAIEELARIDSSCAATVASHNSLALGALADFGTEQQKQLYLPRLAKGELWGFALSEAAAGSDIQNITTKATWDSKLQAWLVSGEKSWITNTGTSLSAGATVLARLQRADPHQDHFTCFLIPSELFEATAIKDKMMWRGSATAKLIFQNAQVSSDHILGEKGQGHKLMLKVLDSGRLSIAAMALGLAKGAFSLALEHAKSRHTFSKPIIEHQAIGFKLADMYCKILAAEDLLQRACSAKMQNLTFAHLASAAKLTASETAEVCAREGQQILGAQGLIKSPMERFYRDAAILRIGEGTSEIQRIVLSKYLKGAKDIF